MTPEERVCPTNPAKNQLQQRVLTSLLVGPAQDDDPLVPFVFRSRPS